MQRCAEFRGVRDEPVRLVRSHRAEQRIRGARAAARREARDVEPLHLSLQGPLLGAGPSSHATQQRFCEMDVLLGAAACEQPRRGQQRCAIDGHGGGTRTGRRKVRDDAPRALRPPDQAKAARVVPGKGDSRRSQHEAQRLLAGECGAGDANVLAGDVASGGDLRQLTLCAEGPTASRTRDRQRNFSRLYVHKQSLAVQHRAPMCHCARRQGRRQAGRQRGAVQGPEACQAREHGQRVRRRERGGGRGAGGRAAVALVEPQQDALRLVHDQRQRILRAGESRERVGSHRRREPAVVLVIGQHQRGDVQETVVDGVQRSIARRQTDQILGGEGGELLNHQARELPEQAKLARLPLRHAAHHSQDLRGGQGHSDDFGAYTHRLPHHLSRRLLVCRDDGISQLAMVHHHDGLVRAPSHEDQWSLGPPGVVLRLESFIRTWMPLVLPIPALVVLGLPSSPPIVRASLRRGCSMQQQAVVHQMVFLNVPAVPRQQFSAFRDAGMQGTVVGHIHTGTPQHVALERVVVVLVLAPPRRPLRRAPAAAGRRRGEALRGPGATPRRQLQGRDQKTRRHV
mmetsp:Transcript_127748/g.409011  ORF Transcript_127748/g.409011 Transcript_127748/m.409011 type:complete len:570 (-) Transcript_127748:9-1718(-)